MGAGVGEVVLSWDAHAPYLGFARHQYRYKTDGNYPAEWTDIPNSGLNHALGGDGSNLTGYTVTGLVGGQVHTFQVRTYGTSSSASDPSDEATATPRSAEVSFGAGSYSVVEGGTVEVTVQLEAAPGREVVVPVSAAGAGGATPPGETGADWSGVPESVTFGAADTAQTFTLAATDDTDVETGESVSLSFGTLPAGVTAGTPSEASVTIVDNDVANAAPTAADGTVTTDEDTAYAFDASDFGFADADTGDGLASVRVVTLPGSGTLAVSGRAVSADQEVAVSDLGGNLTFTPAADGHGSGYASFTFRVSDGTDESASTYTMSIDVTPVNDAPSAGTVTIDDTAPMVGDELTASTADVADPDGLPDPFAPTWKWYRTPSGGAEAEISGATSATYTVVEADLGAALTAKASWTDLGGFANTLASAPTSAVTATLPELSVADGSATEGSPVTFTVTLSAAAAENVTVNWATSVETGDTAIAGTDFTAVPATTLTFMPSDTTQTVTVQTTVDSTGEDKETFTVTLSSPSSNATLAADPTATGTIVDGDAPNAAPTAAAGTVTTDEDTAYAFEASDFGFADTDTDDELASVRVVTVPGSGTLAVSGAAVSADQEVAASDLEGNLTFTPAADEHGSGYASFTFRVSDGTDESAADYTMTIDVNAVNDAPTAADRTVTTDEDTAYAFDASDFGFADADTGDGLASVRVVTVPGSGTLAVSGSAVSADREVAASDLGGNLTYTPAADAHGSGYASFTFRVSDGTDESAADYTMTIDVTPVNDAPTAADQTVTTDEDTAYAFEASDFGFADTDTGDGLASVRVVTLPGSGTLAVSGSAVSADREVAASDLGGNLTFTPAADAHGSGYASFTFRVSDGTAESAADYTMTIDVTPVNDAPTLASALPDRSATVGEAFSYQVPEDAFSDVDGDTLSYAAAQDDDSVLPGWLSFDATTRTFSGTAAPGDTGTVTVRVTASDGNDETASATFALEVTAAANTVPTAADGTVTTDEDTAYAFDASDFGFTDADTGDGLASVRVVTLPGSGTLAVSGSAVSVDRPEVAASDLGGNLTFTPAADGHGSGYASFTFRVSDGTDESAADYTMTIDVNAVNDAPTAADRTVTTDEDTAYAFDASDFGFVGRRRRRTSWRAYAW